MSRRLTTILADTLVAEYPSDGSDQEFSVVYDNPEADKYDIVVRRYIDADRAGFSGYVKDTIIRGLTSIEATQVEGALNAAVERKRKAWEKKWGK